MSLKLQLCGSLCHLPIQSQFRSLIVIFNFKFNKICLLIIFISVLTMKLTMILAVVSLFSAGQALRIHRQESYAWYTFDEGPNGNRCENSDECDGLRTCSYEGWCQGESRPPKNADYFYDESETGNQCPSSTEDQYYENRDYFCDGERTCSSAGWCQGTSR